MNQIVNFGNDSLDELSIFLNNNSPKKILLVTGKKSYDSSGAKQIIDVLLDNYLYRRFYNFEENPKLEDVERGVKLFKEFQCDFIIAIGGGSVLDMAKLINFFNKKQKPFINEFNSLLDTNDIVPLVAIPTTAGTGSEATHFAVVYYNKKKYSIANDLLLPKFVCIAPKFTYKINKYLTVITAMDAFSQAIESYWNVNSTEESLLYSEESIKLVWKYLPKLINENDIDARNSISRASFLAGKAINITKTTAPHAFSYFLTDKLNLPHGHAVAITLPFFCKYNYDLSLNSCNDLRGVNFVKNKVESIASIIGVEVYDLDRTLYSFINDLEIKFDYSKFANDIKFIENWKNNVNLERLKNNPRIVNSETWNDLKEYFFLI